VQKAALAALSLPPGFLDHYNQQLAGNAKYLADAVQDVPSLQLCPSEGGLFAFLNVAKTGVDSDSFCSGLIERHAVAATPGISFGSSWNDHVRISLATDIRDFAEGIDRLTSYAAETANERHVFQA
jgi:aspartate/methionine/tyrosine aminotransferase